MATLSLRSEDVLFPRQVKPAVLVASSELGTVWSVDKERREIRGLEEERKTLLDSLEKPEIWESPSAAPDARDVV